MAGAGIPEGVRRGPEVPRALDLPHPRGLQKGDGVHPSKIL